MSVWRRSAATLLYFFKQSQLALAFDERKPVMRPGSRGGKGYTNRWGKWVYGERPLEFEKEHPEANVRKNLPAFTDTIKVEPGVITPVPPYTYAEQPDLASYDIILVNSSAGKDSAAMLDEVVRRAAEAGVADRVQVVHADLGEKVEWSGVKELAERQAKKHGLRFHVVARSLGDLLEQVRKRGKWPGMAPKQRYCTSMQKTQQVAKLLTAMGEDLRAKHPGKIPRILNCIGLRGAENPKRGWPKRHPLTIERSNSNIHVDRWLPIQHWEHTDVWRRIKEVGIEMFPTYAQGVPRLSCVFCIFANRAQLTLSGLLEPERLREYVAVEAQIQHTFKPTFSLADVSADIDKLVAEYGTRAAAIEHVQKDPTLYQPMMDSRVLCWFFWKGKRVKAPPGQLGLFGQPKKVEHPGSRGGTGYYTAEGEWVYGERPAPAPAPVAEPEPTIETVHSASSIAASLGEAERADAAHRAEWKAKANSLPDGTNIKGWVKQTIGSDVFWIKKGRTGREKATADVTYEVGRELVEKALAAAAPLQPATAASPLDQIAADVARACAEDPARMGHGHTGKTGFIIGGLGGTIRAWDDAHRHPVPEMNGNAITVHSHAGVSSKDPEGEDFEPFSAPDWHIFLSQNKERGSKWKIWGKYDVLIMSDGRMDVAEITDQTDPAVFKLSKKAIEKLVHPADYAARTAYFEAHKHEPGYHQSNQEREMTRAFCKRYGILFHEGLRWRPVRPLDPAIAAARMAYSRALMGLDPDSDHEARYREYLDVLARNPDVAFNPERKFKKAQQMGFAFGPAGKRTKPVQHPGVRGGIGYWDQGEWHYGERPAPRPAEPARPIETPAFKSWFGDWENDPAHASKVVDTEGEPEKEYEAKGHPNHQPVVMYHGSQAQFTEFDPAHIGKWNLYGPGFYFTNDREVVEGKYEEYNEQLYFDTREEAEAAPGRTHWVWQNDPGDYIGAGKWVASIKKRRLVSPGYQHKGEIDLDQESREKIAAGLRAALAKRGPGYITKSETENVERTLAEFVKPRDEAEAAERKQRGQYPPPPPMSLGDLHGLIGGQPYNLPIYDVAERSGANIAGKIYPCYLNIRDPVDVEAKPAPPTFLDRIWDTLHRHGSGFATALADRATFDALANPPHDPSWGELQGPVDVQTFLEALEAHVHAAVYSADEMQRRAGEYIQMPSGEWHNIPPIDKQDWPALLKAAGYDGITHTGGLRVGGMGKHRVWIAFDPHQIKAVENTGTWDPSSTDIFKATVQRPGSRGGHWYATPKGEIRYGTPPASTFVHAPPAHPPVEIAPGSQLAQGLARGVYTTRVLETKPSYYFAEKLDYDLAVDPITPPGWVDAPPRYSWDRSGEKIRRYDPTLAAPDAENVVRLRPEAGLISSLEHIPKPPGMLWRGMSAEEYASVRATGKIRSLGEYNFENQTGLTYYSTDPTQAESYAHGFAPWQYQATPLRPAYVIGVRDPGTAIPISRPDAQTMERGIPGAVPASDILAVYEAVPYFAESGRLDISPSRSFTEKVYQTGSSSAPSVRVGWRELPAQTDTSFAASAVLAFNERLRAGTHPGKNEYGMPAPALLFLRYSRDGLAKAQQLGFKPSLTTPPLVFRHRAREDTWA